MTTRFEIERAAMRAVMPSAAKALMLALCTRVDARSGQIEAEYSPSLAALGRMTGLHVSTVCRHLAALETAGWLSRSRPDPAGCGEHQTTWYALWIPADSYPQPSRRPRPAPLADAEAPPRRPRAVPVADAEAPPSRSASQSSRPTDRDPIVISDDDIATAQTELAQLSSRPIDRAIAAEAARLVLSGRTVRNRAAYLRRALRADPQRFIPASGPVPYRDLARHQAEQIAKSKGKQ